MLPIYIIFRRFNGFLQQILCITLILARFRLLFTNNILNRLRKLWHITPFYIFADLHGIFQIFKIWWLRQYYNGLSLRAGHKAKFRLFDSVRCYRQKSQLHSTGYSSDRVSIYHLVKVEVIFPILVLFRLIDIAENELSNSFYNGCSIYIGSFYFSLDILFLIRKEIIGITRSADVVLTLQTV